MIKLLPRRRRRFTDDPSLDEAQRKVEELEDRADRAVRRVLAEGQRNHFADRLRATLPRPNGA